MMIRLRPLAAAALVAAAFSTSVPSFAARWEAIPPEVLADARPPLDAESGAEILLHEQIIDDSDIEGTSISDFYRVRIRDKRGVEALEKLEFSYSADERITGFRARVIRPDGTFVEVERGSIFERDAFKKGSDRVRTRSFTFPNLEPGVIVEYYWERFGGNIGGRFLTFHDRFPCRLSRVKVRPYSYPGLRMQTIFRAFPPQKLELNNQGYYTFQLSDTPAYREEPSGLPSLETQPWVLFFFTLDRGDVDSFWRTEGRETANQVAKFAKVTADVRSEMTRITAGAPVDVDRLTRLHDFCRTEIRNVYNDVTGTTPDEEKARRKNGGATDVLRAKAGTPGDIRRLMVAFAAAAGLEARIARVADRDFMFFDKKITWSYVLSDEVVAIKLGDTWRYCDPGNPYLRFGELSWYNENVPGMICLPKDPEWIFVPASVSADSKISRVGRLKIDDEGTLTGRVKTTYSGPVNARMKHLLDAATDTQRLDLIAEEVRENLPDAIISEFTIENVTSPSAELVVVYSICVPAYGELTGQRIFVAPSVFEKGGKPLFPTASRTGDIYFRTGLVTEDDIEIDLPEGYELEEGSAPHTVDGAPLLNCAYTLRIRGAGKQILFKRVLAREMMRIPAKHYAGVKELFDYLHEQDGHVITFKRAETSGAPAVGGAQ